MTDKQGSLGLFEWPSQGPFVIPHRGGALEAPENTLEACAQSALLGVELIELDFRLSKDRELVAIHDSTVDRTTNGTGKVSSFTTEELKRLDAGFRFTKDQGKNYPFRGKGVRIATLDEILASFPQQKFLIELKDSTEEAARRLSSVVARHNAFHRVLVVIINVKHRSGKRLRQIDPRLTTGHTARETSLFIGLSRLRLSRWLTVRGQTFEVPMRKFRVNLPTRSFIEAAHRKGVLILVWTINDAVSMTRLIELGVDGIITDEPSKLIQALKEGRSKR